MDQPIKQVIFTSPATMDENKETEVIAAFNADGTALDMGTNVLYGTAAPTTEGTDGDFYIRTTTHYLYGPKANGTWPAGTALVGATGATGAAGATGATGAAGTDPLSAVITVTGTISDAAKATTSAEPASGKIVPLKFTSGNSAASVTVAFDGGTPRAVNLGGAANSGAELTVATNGIAFFYFDGTILHQLGVVS